MLSFGSDAFQNVQGIGHARRVECGPLQRLFVFSLLEVLGVEVCNDGADGLSVDQRELPKAGKLSRTSLSQVARKPFADGMAYAARLLACSGSPSSPPARSTARR
jgi:hypothetical protein